MDSGLLIIVSGPAGSGKTTLCDRMLAEIPQIERVVTSTTRPPRGGEVDTVDYHFFDHATFRAKVAAGDFLEHARVHGNLYGTLRETVYRKLAAGTDLLLNMDVQGAAHMRQVAREDPLLQGKVVTVFIMPPSLKELESRLRGRETDEDAEIKRRMEVAVDEMQQSVHYDHTIHSGSRDEDFDALKAIYLNAKAS